MQKSIEKLLDIFNSNQFEKEEYLDALDECDEVIYDFLKDKNYRNETNVNLFRISTDERLSIAQNKMQLCEDNPNYALKEVIKSKMQHLETFVDKYRIGFIQSAELQETGYVKVTIPCLITARNYFDNPHTAKQVFKAQIQLLKDKGFIIEKDDMGYYFENNETNISLFKRILTDRKCKHIEIKTLDSRIRMLSFIIHINDIDKMNEVVTKIEVLKTDILNEDEKIILKKNIDEIKFAKSFLDINDIRAEASCCSLIESYFSEICKIFSFRNARRKIF